MSRFFACLMSEGRQFHDLATKQEQENERSPSVLQLNFGTVSIGVSSEQRRDLDGWSRCKRSEVGWGVNVDRTFSNRRESKTIVFVKNASRNRKPMKLLE